MQQVLKAMLENVRAKTPLVHNITNYVCLLYTSDAADD